MPRLICVQAQVDSLVGAGTRSSIPPPFLSGPEEHARMEGPPVEPGLAQPVAFQQSLAEVGLLCRIPVACQSRPPCSLPRKRVSKNTCLPSSPRKRGSLSTLKPMDSCLRRNDGKVEILRLSTPSEQEGNIGQGCRVGQARSRKTGHFIWNEHPFSLKLPTDRYYHVPALHRSIDLNSEEASR